MYEHFGKNLLPPRFRKRRKPHAKQEVQMKGTRDSTRNMSVPNWRQWR